MVAVDPLHSDVPGSLVAGSMQTPIIGSLLTQESRSLGYFPITLTTRRLLSSLAAPFPSRVIPSFSTHMQGILFTTALRSNLENYVMENLG